MPFTGVPRPAVLVLLAVFLSAAAVLVTPAAIAEPHSTTPHSKPPKPTVASVTAQLDRLAGQAERLAENYNRATIEVGAAAKAASVARNRAAAANVKYRLARQRFVTMVTARYETGAFSATGALLGSNDQQSYLDQLSTLDMLSRHQAEIVDSLELSQREATAANARASVSLKAAQQRKADLGARRAAVEKQTAKYRRLLSSLTAAQQRAYSARDSASPAQAATVTSVHAGNAAAQRAVDFALAQVGKPYVFGAAGPDAYDCSGLTMEAWKRGGVNLPHLASDQYNYGVHVGADELQPGDLVFLYNPIGHVSIYIGHGMLVSAPQPGENVKIVPFAYFRSDFTGATRLT